VGHGDAFDTVSAAREPSATPPAPLDSTAVTPPATPRPPDTPSVDLLASLTPALEPDFRLDNLVALSRERALYRAWDRRLKRSVALRVHLIPDSPGRAWFLRESETLAALNHPAVRHVYAAGEVGPFSYRTTNWIDGESLAEAMRRGPRPIPSVLSLVRELLGALEHVHARGIIIRRIVPTTLLLELSGRGVITDLRYSNWCLSHVPADDPAQVTPFVAPEVRVREPGEPASDVYTAAALVYFALTGREPDPVELTPPRALRPAIPAAVERVLLRALRHTPRERYFTATEMLEDFVIDAGVFHEPAASPSTLEKDFEHRLRRALGDDYELLEEIGSGGFGRVYRVRDLGLEREAAIKVLHPALTADPGVMERFRREAQLAARLRHPNIVSIYDIQSRAGLQWYVMELVPGANLAQIVKRDGPLSVQRAERLVFEALSALELAHGLGLVHRDIKPENMLLEPTGLLRITDFGLALALRGDRFGGATSRSGTPQFAAPEQLLGERVDQRTDLYSLGAVAYFALLGRAPFEGSTPEAILAKQTLDALPSLREARPDVTRELEDALRRAVASDPAQRYANAAAFREALDQATGGVLKRMLALLRVS
jgi:serine/threonine protein kinase